MNRTFHILAVLVLVAAVGAIYHLKHMVETEQRLLAGLHQQYLDDQEAMRVLRAEWAYLNSPEYLNKLAATHLGMKPVASHQIVADIDSVPVMSEGVGRLAGLEASGMKLKMGVEPGSYPMWRSTAKGDKP